MPLLLMRSLSRWWPASWPHTCRSAWQATSESYLGAGPWAASPGGDCVVLGWDERSTFSPNSELAVLPCCFHGGISQESPTNIARAASCAGCCRHPLWRDLEIVDDPAATPRQKIAARLTKIEKSILQGCLDAVTTCAPCLGALLQRLGPQMLCCMLMRAPVLWMLLCPC